MQFDRVALRKELVATMNTLWIWIFLLYFISSKISSKIFLL